MSGSGHDQSTDIFSADGRVFQVEYACKAVDNGSTAVAACCKDGVVVAVEKILTSRMLEEGSNNRIHAVDRQAGICVCGVLPDGLAVVSRARGEAENSRDIFSTPILGSLLASRIGEFMHVYTTHYAYRPFGCSVIIASYADDGPQLYVADPSGAVAGYYGIALGKGKTVAKTELEKLDFATLTCSEAVEKLTNILHEVHDKSKDKIYEVEVAWVCDKSDRTFVHVPKEMVPHPTPAS
ncbi:proteasome alpha 7 subunit [Trypanosoma equiperdum]|uniref:Proteasome alpha 7 subunit n=5 Tax=Trypanozoon TaxID=39700 RepID=D6XCY8_TRYB2|nr:proteasome alpha 7 subunit [Trypanosoma brucei gambiense DAL972]XP_843674.1 proteasome alpha 7 subunit [Trypanosoma brucei brucei TREU927]AAF89683.1 20S proteasome alpha 7 subunit [Trypanosoma brucei]RHW73918.1 proteasome alpha 7 subunit [Trypanosoma brucei equiperdum]SCU66171.1 proteasome alpha 7 subunit [Trypanosoma equiperdum]AAX69906.1 proteasome alpha 7 subunit [Trypanosoma brucei]AAZ10115.1 proteasome alpha 7 subunit [Trypanosoma brucei brucei TREU927]|eukprot:XP_011771994.1 proteasome alpha 7 subunit [Trypanosoma brucei gambiense DAL972]